MRSLVGGVLASSLAFALSIASCAPREEPRPQLPYPYSTPPPQTMPAPAPTPAAGIHQPAPGFPCRSDQEFQCTFGRCINGRCGGCTQAGDCKPGAQCVPTWFGASCWPGGPVVASPAPAPVPAAPAPGPAPAPAPVPGPVFTPQPAAPQNPSDPFAGARERCLQLTNMYRARVGAPAVTRDPTGESCTDRQSSADARQSIAHGNFGSCGEFAQNTCPNYPGATVEEVMDRCFQQMFDEGPGGGHYDNMTRRKYTRVFCGFAALGRNRFWVNQNFK